MGKTRTAGELVNSAFINQSGSYVTTGSNTFRGTQTLSGSIIPAIDNTYDLGSVTYQWRDVYVSSGSLYIDGTKVLGSTGTELQITTDNGQSIKILEAGSDNIILQSADGDIQLKSSGGGNLLFDPTTGLIDVRGTLQIQDGNKITSSGGNTIQFGNDLGITGSITTTGNVNGVNLSTLSSSLDTRIVTEKNRVDAILTASSADKDSFAEIVTLINSVDTSNDNTFASFYTASVNRLNNLETTSGSVNISVSNLNTFSGSALTRLSALEVETSNLESFTSSINTTIKTRLNAETIVSGSSQVDVMSTTNIARLATTGSNTFVGNQTISGAFARFINTSATSNSNVQLGNDVGTNSAGMALFGSQYASSAQYRANGGYVYSNLAGGLTLHAEGTNSMYLATNNTTAITINSSQNIGIGTTTPIGPLDIAVPAVGSAIGASNAQTAYNYSRLRIKHYSESNLGLSIGYAGANHTYIQACYNEGSTAPLLLNPYGGDVRIGTSGLKFSNGSTNLNYYEEGSWTPQLYAGATAFTMAGINAGKYVRVGNQVTVCGHLQWSGGTGGGMVQVRGLPFTSSGVRSAGSIGAVGSGISFSSGYGMWLLVNDPGTAYIYIIQLSTSGQSYSHEPPVASSGIIYGFTLTYFLL